MTHDIVDAWIAVNGYWCPGFGRRARHPAQSLTVDHIAADVQGGYDLSVLCLLCSSRKAAELWHAPLGPGHAADAPGWRG